MLKVTITNMSTDNSYKLKKANMKKLSVLFFISLLMSVSLMNCNNGGEEEPMPEDNEVWMQNTSFVPQSIIISPGTTLTWINQDNIAHTTTSDDGLWDSGTMNQGDVFEYTFTNVGTFAYRCTIHPNVMTGEIIVE